MLETTVLGMPGPPIRPPAQVPVANLKASLNSPFVACHSLKRTQAAVSAHELNPTTYLLQTDDRTSIRTPVFLLSKQVL